MLLLLAVRFAALCSVFYLKGHIADLQGMPVPHASITVLDQNKHPVAETMSGRDGEFRFTLNSGGPFTIHVRALGFLNLNEPLTPSASGLTEIALAFRSLAEQKTSVFVAGDSANAGIEFPDPSTQLFGHDQLLDANPGLPGAPLSIPGYPIPTASGGIKAPQYFAPGVAGDHGEPIATFFQVGSYRLPDNLSANAHGNGYSDPNVLIAPVIESVQVDNGAFNVREGNHSVNLSDTYNLRSRIQPFFILTGDYRDVDVVAGWSPADPSVDAFIAIEAAYGDGFLQRPEHRQQYKLNTLRSWSIPKHRLTLFAAGYYGFSFVPGLVPLDAHNLHDTIDPRQKDQTHTAAVALNDVWNLSSAGELQSSAYFRSYNLSLYSNFGGGLIRQSEFRTVMGADETYVKRFKDNFSLLAGTDFLREAPRRLDLDQYENSTDFAFYGPFQPATANNLTLNFVSPYIAVTGKPYHWLRYYLGWRRDQLDIDNQDLLRPANSFSRWNGINSPKATVTLTPPESWLAPEVSFSYGQAFFSNDPRIGNGTTKGSTVSRAHSYQLMLSKQIGGTDFRLTFGRLTQEESLAKFDPDTGLQLDVGPSRNYFVTFAARHYFNWGILEGSVSKADARDLLDGLPVPEAPRLIVDFLGTLDRLPFQLHARGEYEQVGAKPLGDGFVGSPVNQFRGALSHRWDNGRIEAGLNFQIASGYTGQTTEVLALPGESAPFERVVGVYLPSYVSLSFTFRF